MTGLRKIWYIFIGQFMDSLTNVRVWVGYLICIAVALKGAYGYIGYAGDRVFQVFEPYIINFSGRVTPLFMLIGFVVIISDAPFVDNRSTLTLYRTSRGQWFWGMSVYILVHGIIYFLTGLLASCIFVIRQAYVENIWSSMLKQFIQSPSEEARNKWGLGSMDGSLIVAYEPVQAMLHTILLFFMYCMILSIIIFIFNTAFNKAAGTAIAAAVHIVGYIMAFDVFNFAFGRWSLFFNSMFSYVIQVGESMSIANSYLLLALVLCILIFIGPNIMRRADFRYSSGEENE